jgi:hypothetical protein
MLQSGLVTPSGRSLQSQSFLQVLRLAGWLQIRSYLGEGISTGSTRLLLPLPLPPDLEPFLDWRLEEPWGSAAINRSSMASTMKRIRRMVCLGTSCSAKDMSVCMGGGLAEVDDYMKVLLLSILLQIFFE